MALTYVMPVAAQCIVYTARKERAARRGNKICKFCQFKRMKIKLKGNVYYFVCLYSVGGLK